MSIRERLSARITVSYFAGIKIDLCHNVFTTASVL